MSITKHYLFLSVPYNITSCLKNWYPDLFPSQVDAGHCVYFHGVDGGDFMKKNENILISWDENPKSEYVFSFGGVCSNFYFPKIFFSDNFLSFQTEPFFSLQKTKLCYLQQKHSQMYANALDANSWPLLDADDNDEQNLYKFTLCFSADDVWTAIQACSIPILLEKLQEKDLQVFNTSRCLYYSKDISSLVSLHDGNNCLYQFLYEQPVFQNEVKIFFENQKIDLKSKLLPIMLNAGYFCFHKNELPPKEQDLESSKQTVSMEQYNSFYSNFPYRDFLTKKQINSFNPSTNGRKVLLLFAAHVNSQTKFEIIQNNITHFRFQCVDIAVANTAGLQYSSPCKDFCSKNSIQYFELENDEYIDFGKYIFLLGHTNYKNYHTVLFANDSFIIHHSMDYFINSAIKTSASLFAYNDSSENKYHFQSYLFAIKSNSIVHFLNLFFDHFEKIKIVADHYDIIKHYEMNLFAAFDSADCFLKIGKMQRNLGKNIFFNNDEMYKELFVLGLLPFTKLKRYLRDTFQSTQLYTIPKRSQLKFKQTHQFILQADSSFNKF